VRGEALGLLTNNRLFIYSDLEFGKSEIQSYLADYINWKLSKKDQGTSMPSYITKHIDNLFIRTSPLHVACQSDQYYESANALMDLGFNPDQKDPNGFAPLHVAADKKAVKIVQLLIENNAKLDIRDDKYQITPIFFAANNNSTQIVTLLIQNKAKINQSDPIGRNPLHFAVKNNSLEAAKILLESGADVNARDAFGNSSLHIAVDLNLVEMVKLLLSYEANPNVAFPIILNADNTIGCALHLAVAKHSLEMVKVLLNGGADPNQTNCNGETALHLAAAGHILLSPNRLLIVDLLIKKGAKPNVIDNCGRTVLYNAIFNKVEDVARILLELDCSIEVVNQRENKAGLAPLHLAAWHKFENITTMLIAKRAKIDITDKNGLTPLEYAAASNAVNVAKRLLESDAEAISRFQTKNIRSPLHVAAAYDALEVGILFISKGADIHSIDGLGLTPLHYATYRKSTRFIEFLNAKQENCLNASADVSDEPDLRKPKRNSKRYRNQQRRHQQPQERDNSQERKQQQNQTPYLSKNLSPEELASIPQLIDCFKVINSDIPNFQINRPSYETQFPNITFSITQVTNFAPGYV
jgi:ankyrin repeat protein